MDRKQALEALTALSQETRLEVFRLLVRLSPDGLAAGAIAARLGVVQNTMSAHLAVLARAGLVQSTRTGRSVQYAVQMSAMSALLTYLLRDCCRGAPEICAPVLDLVSCDL